MRIDHSRNTRRLFLSGQYTYQLTEMYTWPARSGCSSIQVIAIQLDRIQHQGLFVRTEITCLQTYFRGGLD
ncbi:hypothetical protein BH09BAC4_BH09BAC4_31820 [soil metagenome]